jgi:hypothetical protein
MRIIKAYSCKCQASKYGVLYNTMELELEFVRVIFWYCCKQLAQASGYNGTPFTITESYCTSLGV